MALSKPTSKSSKPPSKSYWKGKDKATADDFDDLFPTITYRHLQSHNLGVRDPLRVIALCDSDAFYAACEQVRLGLDPELPLVVQQWDALIAVNYPARKFGISRMDKVRDAKKRCPELNVVHVATYKEGEPEPGYWPNPDTRTHKVSLDHYRRESMKIIQMFKDGLPEGEVEKASIDEAFIDFTRPVREELLRRFPHLATVPPDAPNGADTPLPPPPPISWDGVGNLVPVHPQEDEPTGQENSEREQDDGYESDDAPLGDGPEAGKSKSVEDDLCAEAEKQTTWHDVALSIAAGLMMRIREDIRDKLGYTTSAGLARNKFLAKLTASYKKPMNQTILRNAAIPNYLRPMPFQKVNQCLDIATAHMVVMEVANYSAKIRFLGGKLGKALAEEYDVSTVSDLLTISLEEMQRKFGEESIWVYEILRGIDRSEVKEKSAVNKSMLAAKNLPQPITKAEDGQHWLRVLAADLALRLNDAREINSALWPKTIVVRASQGWDITRSKQMPFPFTRSVTVDVVASFGDRLWKELFGTRGPTPFKVTTLSLAFSGIGIMEAGQRTIEGFLASRSSSNDQQSSTVTTRDASKSPTKPHRKRQRSPSDTGAERKQARTTDYEDKPGGSTGAVDAPDLQDGRFSFVCEKCRKRVWLPGAPRAGSDRAHDDMDGSFGCGGAGSGEELVLDDAIRGEMLAALRLEHADWHFAHELAAAGDEDAPKRVIRPSERPGTSTAKRRKKKTTEDGGIARFFTKK